MRIYTLNCIECGHTWNSNSGDVCECPMRQSGDIVVIKVENE